MAEQGEKSYNGKPIDRVKGLAPDLEQRLRFELECVDPMDAKYAKKVRELNKKYLSHGAELKTNAYVQYLLLETLGDFGKATPEDVTEAKAGLEKVDALNIDLLEDEVTKHDQLAVIVEYSRHVNERVAAIMHPGTTSYDIVDTTRSFLFKGAYQEFIRPAAKELIEGLLKASDEFMNVKQVGRTHLKYTAPILFGAYLSSIARRLAEAYEDMDNAVAGLKGKVSGIVGTGAGIEQYVGEGNDVAFEMAVLKKLGLKPEMCLSQIISKESYLKVGQAIHNFASVLGKFANDIRLLYGDDIKEVCSREKIRTGGSSTDAFKDNPIDWENMAGTHYITKSGLVILEAMVVDSNLQRHLTDSKLGRFEPQRMMSAFYETLLRGKKAIKSMSVNDDMMKEHLGQFEKAPSEPMVTILKSYGFRTDIFANSHEFVKKLSEKVKMGEGTLIKLAMKDETFKKMYETELSDKQRQVLQGDYEKYLGSSETRARINIAQAKNILGRG